MDWDDEYLNDTLKNLDNDQILSIMAIGEESISRLKLQKIVFLSSRILKIDINDNFEAYDYGMYNESLMEEVMDMPEIISKDKKLSLTDFGLSVFKKLMEILDQKIIDLFQSMRRLNETDLLKIAYHLYPELTVNSKIKGRVIYDTSQLNFSSTNSSGINRIKKAKYDIKRNGDSIEIIKVE